MPIDHEQSHGLGLGAGHKNVLAVAAVYVDVISTNCEKLMCQSLDEIFFALLFFVFCFVCSTDKTPFVDICFYNTHNMK